MTVDVTHALGALRQTHERLREVLAGLTDDLVTGPSSLPGWTRGHVLAHIAGIGTAAARQLEAATVGEVVEFYVGGRPARDAAIEAGARASAAEHAERVEAAIVRVEGAVQRLTPEVLDRITGFRDRPAGQVVTAWWREAEIHLTDLDLGATHATWDGQLRDHLAAYLEPRVPEGVRLHLSAADTHEERSLGDGAPVLVSGSANDLIAWLAGREPLGPLTVERDGATASLPELGPWP